MFFFCSHGGIIPPIARDLHRQHIEHVVHDALKAANIELSDVDAIAPTVKPGMNGFCTFFYHMTEMSSLNLVGKEIACYWFTQNLKQERNNIFSQ
jgi:tRNA A37 threonylcarbamoyltransferase TsaD